MAAIRSEQFKWAVDCIDLIRGPTRCQAASDPGSGLSTLGKWVRVVSERDKVPAQDGELLRENERLLREPICCASPL